MACQRGIRFSWVPAGRWCRRRPCGGRKAIARPATAGLPTCARGVRQCDRTTESKLADMAPDLAGSGRLTSPDQTSFLPKSMFLTKRTRQPIENKGSSYWNRAKRTPNEPQTNPQKGAFFAKRTASRAPTCRRAGFRRFEAPFDMLPSSPWRKSLSRDGRAGLQSRRDNRQNLGALAPVVASPPGLKAHLTEPSTTAGLKPRPSVLYPAFSPRDARRRILPKSMFLTKRTRQLIETKGSGY